MKKVSALRPSKRERKKLQTPNPEARQRLMDAASDIIRAGGYNALRIEAVAERAGLSVGTFYLYFEGKADLFVEIVIDYTERLLDRLQEAYHTEGTVPERMTRGLDAYLDFVEENELGFIHFVQDASVLETTAGRLSDWAFQEHAEALRPLLEEGISSGEMRPQNPMLAAQALVGMTQHICVFWLQHHKEYTRQQIRSFLIGFPAAGLTPQAPRASARSR